MQRLCEAEILDDVGNWIDYCYEPPIKIISERTYCEDHAAEREKQEERYRAWRASNGWHEGCWDETDNPVMPEGTNYVWVFMEGWRFSPRPKHVEDIDYMLLSASISARERNPGCSLPRWWWYPLEDPPEPPKVRRD
jgi:hypothetical protein